MIYTITELSKHINFTADLLRLYLGHFSLSKYVFMSYKNQSRPSYAIDITEDFITDFMKYLSVAKRKEFKKERLEFVRNKLEELLNCEIHQEMHLTTCTNPPTIA